MNKAMIIRLLGFFFVLNVFFQIEYRCHSRDALDERIILTHCIYFRISDPLFVIQKETGTV